MDNGKRKFLIPNFKFKIIAILLRLSPKEEREILQTNVLHLIYIGRESCKSTPLSIKPEFLIEVENS